MAHACQRCGRTVTAWNRGIEKDDEGLAFCSHCSRDVIREARQERREDLLSHRAESEAQNDPGISRAIAIAWDKLKSGDLGSFIILFQSHRFTTEEAEVVTRAVYTRAHRLSTYTFSLLGIIMAAWFALLALALFGVEDQAWAAFGWYTGIGIIPWMLLIYAARNYEHMESMSLSAILRERESGSDILSKVRSRQGARLRLFDLTPRRFEVAVADVFQRYGYQTEVTSFVRDAGVDLLLKDGNGERYAVQIKQYKTGVSIGRPELQRLQGAMLNAEASRAIFVTLSHFSEPAIRYAGKHGIRLVDGEDLIDMLVELNLAGEEEESTSQDTMQRAHTWPISRSQQKAAMSSPISVPS